MYEREARSRDAARLGLGTASFLPDYGLGAPGLQDDAEALLRSALASGVRYFDTAALYGESESWAGRFSAEFARLGVRVCTKLRPGQVEAGLSDSLRRLQTKRIDTVLLHSVGVGELESTACWMALERAKEAGSVVRTGASTYGVEAAVFALAQPWCDVIQVEHSILNPSVVPALAVPRRPGQEVAVRSVLCKGLLTERRNAAAYLHPDAALLLDELEQCARGWGFSLPELAIRYALDTAGVDVVLVGVSSRAELAVALSAAEQAPLDATQIEALRDFGRAHEEWTHPECWTMVT
jgi:aryl-alcohol dehydrogenase-like predicted oxidoreductase